MLASGFYDVAPGKIATVVTHLEMTEQANQRPVPEPEGVKLRQVDPTVEWYRDLYRRVGGQDWLWFARIGMSDKDLSDILRDPSVIVYALIKDDVAEGYLELDFRIDGECELAYFGVTSVLLGTGAGRYLMNAAIRLAWQKPIKRFHVHTCTLDHPDALGFYRRSGFRPYRQQIEIADDPRLAGQLPMDAGRRVPIIR
ncbi:MAG: GNAT family N-acetyltransferase [Rhodobacteraceae bacterium]|nr:GNAT family N-acetyltransferase [Paracoccaceae bacterium]